jgi:hypothetical protein
MPSVIVTKQQGNLLYLLLLSIIFFWNAMEWGFREDTKHLQEDYDRPWTNEVVWTQYNRLICPSLIGHLRIHY